MNATAPAHPNLVRLQDELLEWVENLNSDEQSLDAGEMRKLAEVYERWATQLRFLADGVDGSAARRSPEQLN